MLGGLVLLAAFGLLSTGPVYWTCLLVLWGILLRVQGWLEVSAIVSAVAAFSVAYSGLELANEGSRFSGEMSDLPAPYGAPVNVPSRLRRIAIPTLTS